MQSLGKIALRAPAVGANPKMWCFLFFVFFFCHAPSSEHRAFEGCIVRISIALLFIVRFRRGFQPVFARDSSFRCTAQFSHSSLGGATIFAKLRSEIAKSPKIRWTNFVRTKSHTGLKFFEQLYTGWIVVVHLCFGFSLWRQMAPQESLMCGGNIPKRKNSAA